MEVMLNECALKNSNKKTKKSTQGDYKMRKKSQKNHAKYVLLNLTYPTRRWYNGDVFTKWRN